VSSGQIFASTQRHDPYRNFNYEVSFVGYQAIYKTGWSAVSGIKLQHNYNEYQEGGNNGVPDQIHTNSQYQPVTMERGMSEDISIIKALNGQWDSDGKGITKNKTYEVIIKVKDRDNSKVVKTVKLKEAWIVGFETGDLIAGGAEVLLNRIILGFKSVTID
jgi:phage tail-like protein